MEASRKRRHETSETLMVPNEQIRRTNSKPSKEVNNTKHRHTLRLEASLSRLDRDYERLVQQEDELQNTLRRLQVEEHSLLIALDQVDNVAQGVSTTRISAGAAIEALGGDSNRPQRLRQPSVGTAEPSDETPPKLVQDRSIINTTVDATGNVQMPSTKSQHHRAIQRLEAALMQELDSSDDDSEE